MVFISRQEISGLDNDMHDLCMIKMLRKTAESGSRARTVKIITQQIEDVTTTNRLKLFIENQAYKCLSQKAVL